MYRRRIPLRVAALNSRWVQRGVRWCGSGEQEKEGKEAKEWKKKKLADMSLEELEQYEKSLTWWPYVLLAVFMVFVWTPEGTKFIWHIRLQMWVHEQYWKLVLPADQANSLIREHRIGIPTAKRTVQNPLAACPISEADRQASVHGQASPPTDAFSASVVQVYANINQAHANNPTTPAPQSAESPCDS